MIATLPSLTTRDARITRVWRDGSGRITSAMNVSSDVGAGLQRYIQDRAAYAIAAAPASDDDGIDVAGVDAYLAARGLPGAPSVILSYAEARAYPSPDSTTVTGEQDPPLSPDTE